jgi:transcriptional regulator with XRE-family HTH domain
MARNHGDDTGGRATDDELSDGVKVFGSVLQALRRAAGLTQEEFASEVKYSVDYVAKIEQGKRFPPVQLPDRARPALGEVAASVLKAAAKDLRRKVGLASWFQHWAQIEEDAVTLYAYECRVVPGLLQPEPYAREVLGSHLPPLTDAELESRLAARLERQKLLTAHGSTAFGFIVEQAVIERGIGGAGVTDALLDHLIAVARLRNVELLVMPRHRREHSGPDGPMYLAESPGHQWLGYVEAHESSLLITEPKHVSAMLQRYGRMQGQALDPDASVGLLKQLRGAP